MAQLMNVRLSRVDAQPWGLRLQGGKDFGTPLLVQKVSTIYQACKRSFKMLLQPSSNLTPELQISCIKLYQYFIFGSYHMHGRNKTLTESWRAKYVFISVEIS